MPVGECQQEFKAAAAQDGITLAGQSFDWLCEQGHFGLLRAAESSGEAEVFERAMKAAEILEAIYLRLHGDVGVLKAGRTNRLRGDYFHDDSRTLIEVDEEQHFTSFRLTTLNLYPEGTDVGFDLDEYKHLCRRWAHRSDNYRRNKSARGFGEGGRQRQRAYCDSPCSNRNGLSTRHTNSRRAWERAGRL